MSKDAADYEKSEEAAITSGKAALARAPWLFARKNPLSKGFFFEAVDNDVVHPGWYEIHAVDGVGTKLFYSAWSGNFRLQPQDALAMNANDLATAIRAWPSALNLYFAVQTPLEEQYMGEIMAGFVDALEKIRVPGAPFECQLGKIETASLDEMIALGVKGLGWDVGVVMIGYMRKDNFPHLAPKPGHVIVGLSSSGLNSNGHTSARHLLLTPEVEYRDEWKPQYHGRFQLSDCPAVLQGASVLEALMVPTPLYLREALLLGQEFDSRDIYGVNITGNGLMNFNRAGKGVSFHITDPLPMLPIHELLIGEAGLSPEQAYVKHNMGMGFALIVPTQGMAERMVTRINERGEHHAQIVGDVHKSEKDVLETMIHKPYEGKPLAFAGYSN